MLRTFDFKVENPIVIWLRKEDNCDVVVDLVCS